MRQPPSYREVFWNQLVILLTTIALASYSLGAVVGRDINSDLGTSLANGSISSPDSIIPERNNSSDRISSGDFPICTDFNGPFVPFCLPVNGADVLVDTTYYVTWNADFYPLNATVNIELRYSDSAEGTSAFTSKRTANSYGYIPIHMRYEWLQGKANNSLTLYIIELDPTLDRRASARQGPTIMLRPKPLNYSKPSPPATFNKLALYIGLPVSLAVVVAVVAGLVCGMRKNRMFIMRTFTQLRNKGYGIGKSKTQRLENDRKQSSDSDESTVLKKYSDDLEAGLLEGTTSNRYNNELERTGSYAFRRDVSKLKSWAV
ncbi:hypothetical protein P175DRAFT_0505957 [Aspergillus ochraceoroseus IBT 24754]|uniref:Uncharacterized protein n=1 Tax=Aspergillus ochraceoroseus IBT 24754 TaxID=1392256 RepID=A0A2T5M6W8_9EURO|nr:uncharacterized protein P175DRAFT_0505957 [Aspergillus ochraceoroseus IBT 24754]PTU24281.1 hypothetical protein P175DRAFT_0505957 [Aspergillus ochraceoroseus IBT 24754]